MDRNDLFSKILELYYHPHQSSVLGITGRAGAGKTTFTTGFVEFCIKNGVNVVAYNGDWDFILSSKERKEWIEAPRMAGDLTEYARRANQENWWDFEAMSRNIGLLRSGSAIHLTNAYDQRTGEKNLSVPLEPPKDGLIIIEQPFIGFVIQQLDGIVYLHIKPDVGFMRLFQRDVQKRGIYASVQRFAETTMSEDLHLSKYLQQMQAFGQKFVFVDNTEFNAPNFMPDSSLLEEIVKQPFTSLLVPMQYLSRNGAYNGAAM